MKEPTQSVIQSVENRIEEFDTHPEIIENFDLLKRTGVLDDILDYVVSKLLEKFVPPTSPSSSRSRPGRNS